MSRTFAIAAVTCVFAGLCLLGSGGGAWASGLMSACKADLASLCSGVKEGRGRLSACLFAHDTSVSGTCKPELEKVTNSSTFKTMLPASLNDLHGTEQAADLNKTCNNDIKAQCGGIGPGTERVLACLYSHSASISKPCYAKAKALIEGK